MPRPSTTLFEDAIDIPLWLEADRGTPFAERLRRDRNIASAIATRKRLDRIRSWWHAQLDHRTLQTGTHLARTRRVVTLAMIVLGALTGGGVAAAAFHYDGSMPVNIVTLLAVLVAAPLLLLVPTLLLAIGRTTGAHAISHALGALSPGGVAAALYRRIAKPPMEVAQLFGWHAARSAAAGRFSKWQLLYWSQTAAVTFALASIATGVALIAFTDLAFGWSTTLGVDAQVIGTIVRALALPWHALMPSAVPDAALIEASQFFRLHSTDAEPLGASRTLAGWWSFVIVAIICYGLLPRLLLLALATWRLRAATAALLLEDPRVTALDDRMDAPLIETAATEPERAELQFTTAASHPRKPRGGAAAAVIWGSSLEPTAAREFARSQLGLTLDALIEAGGDRSLEEDRATVATLVETRLRSMVVFTRAWEPPLLELLDYLTALRMALGKEASIVVVPVAEPGAVVSDVERTTWTRAMNRLADAQLYVEAGTP